MIHGVNEMSAADKRIQELLDRWLASIEHHLRYLQLDDAAYARAEAWPRHQRPTRWIVELARTRLLELQASLHRSQATGDSSFAESLELMSFLTSLLASEHIERFIPLATGKPPDAASTTGTVEQPRVRPRRDPARNVSSDKESSAARKALAKRQASRPTGIHPPRKPSLSNLHRRSAAAAPAKPSVPLTAAEAEVVKTVVADAVRFLDWGTEWPALAGKIAHLAGRPPENQVRNILRAHRDAIQQRSKRRVD